MRIRQVKPEEIEQWLAMRTALWPETDEARHRREMAVMLADTARYAVFICEDRSGALVGFAEVALRKWAEGCLSSPVGYLEGWYVASHCRRNGIGTRLLAASEQWARSRGCTEMASDTDIGNNSSEAAHLKLGFQEAARLIAFRKNLSKD